MSGQDEENKVYRLNAPKINTEKIALPVKLTPIDSITPEHPAKIENSISNQSINNTSDPDPLVCPDSTTEPQVSSTSPENEQVFADEYRPPLVLTMDSTNIVDISTVNIKYPEKILSHATSVYDFDLLQRLKVENIEKYENAAVEQVKELWRDYVRINAHGSRDRVHLLLKIGTILNDYKDNLGRAKFGKYQKDNFKNKHLRYFQHARQLARKYDFCFHYAALGKNRLLELLRLLEKEDIPDIEFIKCFGFIDITKDDGGRLFKKQIDAIITLYRLTKAGIGFATFQDAELMVSYKKEAIEYKEAKKVKNQLDKLSADEAGKEKAFGNYLKDKLIFKNEGEERASSPPDLNKLLADFIATCDPKKINDPEWAAFQREILCEDIFIEAHKRLHLIADKFNIEFQS